MENQKNHVSLLRGTVVFCKDDPLWYRIIVILILVIFILGLILLLKNFAAPVLATFRALDKEA